MKIESYLDIESGKRVYICPICGSTYPDPDGERYADICKEHDLYRKQVQGSDTTDRSAGKRQHN